MDSITTRLSTSTRGGPIVKIQQSIPSGSIKKGPHAIIRSANLNDGIEIRRRFVNQWIYSEGSKPLFDRDDITVNQTTLDTRDNVSGCKSKLNRTSSSTESSSPERYRHRDKNKKYFSPTSGRLKSPERSNRIEQKLSPNSDKHTYTLKYSNTRTDKYKKREKSKSRSTSPGKKKLAEKVPYYRDEKREKDRLKRLYGHARSRTPPHSSSTKRRIESPPKRRRSSSRDRLRRHSPYRTLRRDYRSRRSRTRSRTRSPQRRDRHKHSSRSSKEREQKHKEDVNTLTTAIMPATPQFIPIPVAVPADYTTYSFPGWTGPQPSWHPPHHRPPPASHFAPFPMLPMMPSIRPPHQTPYGGMHSALPYAPITAPYRSHAQRFPIAKHSTNTYRPRKPLN